MSAPRLVQARIRIDSAAYSESCKILKNELNKCVQPLHEDKGLINSLNFFLLCSVEYLLSSAPQLVAANKQYAMQNTYIVQLNSQLVRYCNVLNSQSQREEEEKALWTKLQEGLQFNSIASLLYNAKAQLNASTMSLLSAPLIARMPRGTVSSPSFANLLDGKTLSALARVSTSHAVLFRDEAVKRSFKRHKKIHNLFQHLAAGETDKVEAVLIEEAKNPVDLKALLKTKHTVTDQAERQFDNITLFQLALWNLNEKMWLMLLKYFNKCLPEEAEAQYQAHTAEGRNCPQYVKEHGKYYNSESKEEGQQGIVAALKACTETYDSHVQLYANRDISTYYCVPRGEGRESLEQADAKWRAEVGAASKRIPAHVPQEDKQRELNLGLCLRYPRRDIFGYPKGAERRATQAREILNNASVLFQSKAGKFEALKETLAKNPASEACVVLSKPG